MSSPSNDHQSSIPKGEEPELQQEQQCSREIHGLLVSYKDDEIDDCVHAALQGKRRVHYKCMDVNSNFVAFGTSVGAIYLFRLTTITHASCKLALVIPCDQGSIEVIKFLPGSLQTNDLLVAIGTSRGSLVIFQLICLDEQSIRSHELYRAEEFTKSAHEAAVRIKMIEYDPDYLMDNYNNFVSQANPNCSFSKLYICDQSERIFVLESSSIYPAFKLLYSNRPAHVLSVDESTINQVCVHKSQLLMSTDEKTRLFCEHSNELVTIGKKQRKTKGFFGACFFNPNYKPPRMMPNPLVRSRANMSSSQQTMYSSTNSLMDLENMLIFVARPKFSLWQVNNRREVMLTHIFDSAIRNTPPSCAIKLNNAPISGLDEDNPRDVEQAFTGNCAQSSMGEEQQQASVTSSPRGDHFEKLIQIFSTTLGNLLLSYSKQELFVIDPIRAQLIAWYQHDKPITQVCCNENEIFLYSEPNRRQFQVDRLILLAPTQFILELHRINRFLSLMVFVQMFQEQLRQLMALPLDGPSTITTEGGLLRNIIWNTWRECSDAAAAGPNEEETPKSINSSSSSASSSTSTLDGKESSQEGPSDQVEGRTKQPLVDLSNFKLFKQLVEEIVEESRQLRQSIENLADSRLLFMVSNENIERLCSEPYASMVSLDISIANLHTNHVVHFSQEALQRHKSIAKLSQSIMNLNRLKRASTQASLLMPEGGGEPGGEQPRNGSIADIRRNQEINYNDKRVVVEQLRPKQREQAAMVVGQKNNSNMIEEIEGGGQKEQQDTEENGGQLGLSEELDEDALEPVLKISESGKLEQDAVLLQQQQVVVPEQQQQQQQQAEVTDQTRCANCLWPRARAHLKPMHHSQQIQHNWIQENLLPDFEINVGQIEERAFKHGLWHLILKCYAFRNQLDNYITCCIMLNDIRLLNIDRFSTTDWDEDQLIDRVFEQLQLKLDSTMSAEDQTQSDPDSNDAPVNQSHCFKCKRALPNTSSDETFDDENRSLENLYSKSNSDEEDDISFNLVNLFTKFMLRKNADVKRAVSRLLQHPDLVNRSKISANFYLQAIANQCAAIRRTRLKA